MSKIASVTHDSIAVQDNGIRIPACPECGQPVIIEYGLSTGKFAECPWEDCSAWLAYDVGVTVDAHETRQGAKDSHAEDDS